MSYDEYEKLPGELKDYIEKPFTLYAKETEELIQLATETKRKMTAGHDAQFTHSARRMRELINNGYSLALF